MMCPNALPGDDLERRVDAACKAAGHDDVHVCYSAYESDDDDNPIDNLDEVAAEGRVG